MISFRTVAVFVVAGASVLSAQHHIASSEAAGNYSGIFVGMVSKSGLRNGWSSVPDTVGARSTERMVLATVFVPVAGDIVESSTFAVGVEIPYLSKKFEQDPNEEMSHSGVGDISMVGKYGFTFHEEVGNGSQQCSLKGRADVVGKIKFPIAEHARLTDQRSPTGHELQLGSGSKDYALGFAFLTETQKYFMVHGHAMYWINAVANGAKEGNSIDYELMFLVASLPLEVEPAGTFVPALGVQGIHTARDKMNDVVMENSGSDAILLSIGIQSLWNYLPGCHTFFMVDAAYRAPLLQRVNGVQLGYSSSFSVGIRIYVK